VKGTERSRFRTSTPLDRADWTLSSVDPEST